MHHVLIRISPSVRSMRSLEEQKCNTQKKRIVTRTLSGINAGMFVGIIICSLHYKCGVYRTLHYTTNIITNYSPTVFMPLYLCSSYVCIKYNVCAFPRPLNLTWTKRDMPSAGLAASGKVLMSQLLEPDQQPNLVRKAFKSKLRQM